MVLSSIRGYAFYSDYFLAVLNIPKCRFKMHVGGNLHQSLVDKSGHKIQTQGGFCTAHCTL